MSLPALKLDDLVLLVGYIDAELDEVAVRAPALVGIRNHVRLAQDKIREGRAELLRAVAIERAPAARAFQEALQ